MLLPCSTLNMLQKYNLSKIYCIVYFHVATWYNLICFIKFKHSTSVSLFNWNLGSNESNFMIMRDNILEVNIIDLIIIYDKIPLFSLHHNNVSRSLPCSTHHSIWHGANTRNYLLNTATRNVRYTGDSGKNMTKSDLIFCLDLPSMRLQSWGVSYLVSMLHSDTQQLTDLMTADHRDWDHSWLRSTGRGRQIIISSSNTRDVFVISWSKYFLCLPYVWYYYDWM